MNAGAITVYWRPACGFCMRLDRGLRRAGVNVEKRNIWDDGDAAAFVRSVARGHETVPTVVIGDHAMVNPSLDQVIAAIHEHAPDLAPAEPVSRGGLLDRLLG